MSMSSSSAASAAITSKVPELQVGGPEDKAFWEKYLKNVTDEDVRLITGWQKFLNTLLVYVCFLPPSTPPLYNIPTRLDSSSVS